MKDNTKRVLEIFQEINNIPRKSKNEKQISDWLVKWAVDNGFQAERDEFLDVLITVPASKGYEDRPSIAFQGHMDMVCEKTPQSTHDFSTDPIEMYQEDGWLKAKDTSLGADNGIALAIAMAMATDETVKHPELELLFTVDEETGLTGAVNLKSNWVKSKKLVNIDSEDEGVFTIGCAGGRDAKIFLKENSIDTTGLDHGLKISVGGLKGGHSGVDIHLEKGNANIILARFLKDLTENNIDFGIENISGGSAHNAIPRNSSAYINISSRDKEAAVKLANSFNSTIKAEYSIREPEVELKIEDRVCESNKLFSSKVVDLILALPNGVLYNSAAMEGIVETSCNLAVISTSDEGFNILMSQRSSVMSRLDEICTKIDSVVKLSGATVNFGGGYPAWQPDFTSNILKDFTTCYSKIFGKQPVIEVIHAGLECGVIGAKYSGMEMISVGPTIKNPHSPDEKLEISTINDIWNLLVEYVSL